MSWVRLPDWRIIASGRTTYANDERFRVLHVDGTEEWTLQIRYLTLEDHGLYECQVMIDSLITISAPYGLLLTYHNFHVGLILFKFNIIFCLPPPFKSCEIMQMRFFFRQRRRRRRRIRAGTFLLGQIRNVGFLNWTELNVFLLSSSSSHLLSCNYKETKNSQKCNVGDNWLIK